MSSYYDDYFVRDPSRKIVWEEITGYLLKFIKKPNSVLELGAGYCDFINSIKAPDKTAVDFWSGMPKYAASGVKSKVGDVRNLSKIIKGKYDLIMASNILEHLEMDDCMKLLSACKSLLKEKGALIIIGPNWRYSYRNYFDDYTHKTVFSDITLKAILQESGYMIKRVEPGFMPLTMKSRLPKWRSLIRLYFKLPVRLFAGQMLLIATKN